LWAKSFTLCYFIHIGHLKQYILSSFKPLIYIMHKEYGQL